MRRLREVPPEETVEVLEDALASPHQHGEEGQGEELLVDGLYPHRRDEGVLFLNDDVDGRADEDGRREVEHLVDDRAEGGGHDAPAVMPLD